MTPLLVGHGERLGGVAQQREGLLEAQRPAGEALGQVLALQPLHGEEGLAVSAVPWAT